MNDNENSAVVRALEIRHLLYAAQYPPLIKDSKGHGHYALCANPETIYSLEESMKYSSFAGRDGGFVCVVNGLRFHKDALPYQAHCMFADMLIVWDEDVAEGEYQLYGDRLRNLNNPKTVSLREGKS
jgi:hypothetical protein